MKTRVAIRILLDDLYVRYDSGDMVDFPRDIHSRFGCPEDSTDQVSCQRNDLKDLCARGEEAILPTAESRIRPPRMLGV